MKPVLRIAGAQSGFKSDVFKILWKNQFMKRNIFALLFLLCVRILSADEPLIESGGTCFSVQSGNDVFRIECADSGGLIPLDYKNPVLFTVFFNDRKYDEVLLDDVITRKRNLVKSVSHFFWGKIPAVYEKGIILETVEGVKIYGFKRKKIFSKPDSELAVHWSEEEIVFHSLIHTSEQKKECFTFDGMDGNQFEKYPLVACTYINYFRKRVYSSPECFYEEASAVAPLEYWTIDEGGALRIHPENPSGSNARKLEKILADPVSKKAYVIESGNIKIYEYD